MRSWSRMNVAERRHAGPAVAVSTVAFALETPCRRTADTPGLWVPLVRRIRAPFQGAWALPGGPTKWDQTLTETARHTLVSAAQAEPNYLEQLYAFGSVERSADAPRTVTIAYWAQFRASDFPDPPPGGASSAPVNVEWFHTRNLPPLAFDHADIIAAGIDRLRRRTEKTLVAHRFLEESFTIAELRRVQEIILGKELDPANFRRQVLASGDLEETGKYQEGTSHRPAKYYRFIPEASRPEYAPKHGDRRP